MGKLHLFVNSPVSDSVLQALPTVEESESFYFHSLKLDPDLFGLMIDARPCVAVFSIPDPSSRQEVCGLLEKFRVFRESLGYPKRDPTLRTILVADEKAVSLERWHDLGVHEFIIAPILPKALAFKIGRHHQRAAASEVPEPYQAKEDIIVVRGTNKFRHEETPYGRSPPKMERQELPLSEVTDHSRGLRSFVGENTGTPSKYAMLAAIPELKEEDGEWVSRGDPGAAAESSGEPEWSWSWKRPPSGQAYNTNWSYRGERPQFDPVKRAWRLSGEKPGLEMTRDGQMPERLIDSVETPRGREIVVRSAGESARASSSGGEKFDILEAKQLVLSPTSVRGGVSRASSAERPAYGNKLGGTEKEAPAYSARSGEAGPKTASPEPQGHPKEASRAEEPEHAKGPRWTQHVSQSQKSLERVLMTERESTANWHVDLGSSQEGAPPEELPPELEEISKKLLGTQGDGTERPTTPSSSQKKHEEKPVDGKASPGQPHPPEAARSASDKPANPSDQEMPEELFPDEPVSEISGETDDSVTNPYLDGRASHSDEADPAAEAQVPGRSGASPQQPSGGSRDFVQPASGGEKGLGGGMGTGNQAPTENLISLESSKLADRYNSHVGSGAENPPSDGDLRVRSTATAEADDPMKLVRKEKDPNTWSMQNLDEMTGEHSRKRRAGEEAPAPEEELFETGATPSLEEITRQLNDQVAAEPGAATDPQALPESLREALKKGEIPEWLTELPEAAGRDKAWYALFWKRIQALLRRIRG